MSTHTSNTRHETHRAQRSSRTSTLAVFDVQGEGDLARFIPRSVVSLINGVSPRDLSRAIWRLARSERSDVDSTSLLSYDSRGALRRPPELICTGLSFTRLGEGMLTLNVYG